MEMVMMVVTVMVGMEAVIVLTGDADEGDNNRHYDGDGGGDNRYHEGCRWC